jgi:peptidyl-prolyl cis-trans isomerase B (cyclophilin B)
MRTTSRAGTASHLPESGFAGCRGGYDHAPMHRPLLPIALLVAAVAVGGCGGKKLVLTTTATTTAGKTHATKAPPTTPTTCAPVGQPQPRTDEMHEPAPTGKLAADRRWTVILDTNCGLITIDLDTANSPKTAASFAGLVQRDFFNNLTFHRIANGPDGRPFVIQGGDPAGTGEGGPGYTVVEAPPRNTDYTRGVVAMAKTETEPPGASGSQFFIVTAPDAQLPPDYAVLGHVSAGMAAVDRIAAQPANGNEVPTSPVVIRSATVSEG